MAFLRSVPNLKNVGDGGALMLEDILQNIESGAVACFGIVAFGLFDCVDWVHKKIDKDHVTFQEELNSMLNYN